MGDRAQCHLTIGGKLPHASLAELCRHADTYDLRTDWGGEPFTTANITPGEPIDLFGEELNGGLVDELEKFCIDHKLHYRRWSGGCAGAFNPEIVVSHGDGERHDATATEDEYVVFTTQEITTAESLDTLKATIAKFQPDVPAFELV